MNNYLLSVAIGSYLSSFDGLRQVALPQDLLIDDAIAMAQAANAKRPRPVPYAIVVANMQDHGRGAPIELVTPNDAIAYREGDRLAILARSSSQSTSSASSFVQMINPSFPAQGSYAFSFDELAREIFRIVMAASNVRVDFHPTRDIDILRLQEVLEILRQTYEAFGQTRVSWNFLWYIHVNLGLRNLVEALQDAPSGQDLGDFFEQYTYAAFSLPVPSSGITYSIGNSSGKGVRDALLTYWNSEDQIAETLALLTIHNDTPDYGHQLSTLDWSSYEQLETVNDSALQAWSTVDETSLQRTQAFASLTESQFFSPVDDEFTDAVLRLEGADGESLIVSLTGRYVIQTTFVNKDDKPRLKSQEVRILIPCLAVVDIEAVKKSKIAIECASRKMVFSGKWTVSGKTLLGTGCFEESLGSQGFNFRLSESNLSVTVPRNDPLIGLIPPKISSRGYFLPPSGSGCLAFPKSGFNYLKPFTTNATIFDASGVPEQGQEELICEIKKASEHLLICWTDTGLRPTIRNVELKQRPNAEGARGKVFEDLTTVGDGDTIVIGDSRIHFLIDSNDVYAPSSPVVAAIYKCAPSGTIREDFVRDSIRGAGEDAIVKLVYEDSWRRNLGHIVVPQDGKTALFPLIEGDDGSVLVSESFQESWRTRTNFSIPIELLESNEVLHFQNAFQDLEIGGALTYVAEGTDETAMRWVSLTSWRHLWEKRERLENYLRAYTNLVRRARNLRTPSSSAVFWASFPFSISSWESSIEPYRCESILLSPLHPLRLVWLAAIEATLYRSNQAEFLAGTIEGWNLPFLAANESAGGRMIAMPTDNGSEQLFLGWSMLVPAPTGEARPIIAPEYIGMYRSPGASSGGLNGASVAGAIKEYRRMNAHASTVTIDLAASSLANRAADVDEAVITAMKHWFAKDAGGVSGGIRVVDSLNRRGEAPREKLVELLGGDLRTPLTWSRYSPTGATEPSNLRLLQDAGVALNVVPGSREMNSGVMGQIPLRRFELNDPRVIEGSGRSNPVVASKTGWSLFTDALYIVEGGVDTPTIHTQIIGSAMVDGRSDWTISGETLVSPATLAELMRFGGGKSQMLWEWRPPFLDRTSQSLNQLERRPYLSIVRVPASFKVRVKEKLKKALNREEVSEKQIDSLLGTLGSRGVGLASLVSMGGTHATGALGFYAALELMNKAEKPSVNRFVLPLDACDEFLWTLANADTARSSRMRADLLLIEMTDKKISLAALEIKYRGLEAGDVNGKLPQPDSSQVRKDLDQALLTHKLLVALKNKSLEFDSDTPDSYLWSSAFAALIESAIRLHPQPAPDQTALISRLAKLVDGRLALEIAPPLLLILEQGGHAEDGTSYRYFHTPDHSQDKNAVSYGALIADPSIVFKELDAFKELHAEDSVIIGKWRELLDWAFTRGSLNAGDRGLNDEKHDTEIAPSPLGAESGAANFIPVEVTSGKPPTPKNVEEQLESIKNEGVRFSVGTFLGTVGDSYADFWPGNTALNQMNVGIVGDLGTGKTQLLKALIAKIRILASETQDSPVSMLILDYKQDFQDEMFLDFVGGQIIKPFAIPLNVFLLREPTQQAAFQRAKSVVDVLTKIYGGIGPVQSNNLTEVIMDLYVQKSFAPPTLNTVLTKYRERSSNPDAVVGILNNFVMGGIFSDDPDSLVPFDELLNDRVSVLALDQLGGDQGTKNALVVLFLNQYFEYMLLQKKWPFQGDNPQLRRLNSFLVTDEAHNIMKYNFSVLQDLMLQGRQFGVGTILSSQFLSHFKTSEYNYGEPLRTWFIHKVPNVTATQLIQLGLPNANARDASHIQELDIHQAFYSSLGVSGRFIRGEPFFEYNKQSE